MDKDLDSMLIELNKALERIAAAIESVSENTAWIAERLEKGTN